MSGFVALMYHNVVSEGSLADPHGQMARLSPSVTSYFVTTCQFEAQLAAVSSDCWMRPEELPGSTKSVDPKPRVLLTFDDGWAGSFRETIDVLRRHEARALVFVTTGLIGHPLFLTEDDLAAVPADAFEIGAHTVSHPFLDELSSLEIRRELGDSRARLQDITGTSIDTVSIPNGAIDGRVRQIALDVGHQFVFTSEVGVNQDQFDSTAIRRVAIHRDTSLNSFRSIVAGNLGKARRRQSLLSIPKRVLGSARYRNLRKWALGETSDQGDMSALVTEAATLQRLSSSHSYEAVAVH